MLQQSGPKCESLPKREDGSKYLKVSLSISLSDLEALICGRSGGEVAGVFALDGNLLFLPKIGSYEDVQFSP